MSPEFSLRYLKSCAQEQSLGQPESLKPSEHVVINSPFLRLSCECVPLTPSYLSNQAAHMHTSFHGESSLAH